MQHLLIENLLCLTVDTFFSNWTNLRPLKQTRCLRFKRRTCPGLHSQRGNRSERKLRPADVQFSCPGHHVVLTLILSLTTPVTGFSAMMHTQRPVEGRPLLCPSTQPSIPHLLGACWAPGSIAGTRGHNHIDLLRILQGSVMQRGRKYVDSKRSTVE